MKEAVKTGLTAMLTAITVCGLMFGAYTVGAATQTNITVVVERSAGVSVAAQAQSEAQHSVGIPLPAIKPSR